MYRADVIRSEREITEAAEEELKEEKKIADGLHSAASAGHKLASVLREVLGHEDILTEGPDLFRIRRLLEDLEDELKGAYL